MTNETMQPLLHEYFRNTYYKNVIALSLILLFSIVFNMIYLAIDSILDKKKHYNNALKLAKSYSAAKRRKDQAKNEDGLICKDSDQNFELDKEKLREQNSKIEFSVWSYRNLQISFVHSTLCSLWLIRILITQYEGLFSDLLFYVSWDCYLIIAFSCGYFLYDFYDVYQAGYGRIEWVILLHHVIVLVSFGYNMTHLLSIGYTICALFMEFNSVFLHARKLLKFYGYKNTDLIVRLNKVLNMLTFIVFRFGVLIHMYFSLVNDGQRVAVPYLVMLTTCIGLMTIINVILFRRLFVKDVLGECKKIQRSKSQEISLPCEDAQIKLLDMETGDVNNTGFNINMSGN